MSAPLHPQSARASRARATPRARRALRQRGLDPAAIAGTGPNHRIVEADVLRSSAAPSAAGQRRALSAMRRTVGRRLQLSKQTIPHFYLRQEIDAGPLAAFHAKVRALPIACSLNDIILAACARVLREFPAFRSRIDGDDMVESPDVHIGLAVALDDGLVVPAILHADRLTLPSLAAETKRVAELARARRLENAGQSVFTVSNLGMFGLDEFYAIVNPPEAAILAVGAIREAVLVKKGAMRAGHAMTLALSCDHRVIDGAVAARFIARLKQILESPESALPHSSSS